MKTSLFFSLLMASPFFMQAQTTVDSTKNAPIKKKHIEFVNDSLVKEKPAVVFDKDSVKPKPRILDSLESKEFSGTDSLIRKHIFESKDSLVRKHTFESKDSLVRKRKFENIDSLVHKSKIGGVDSLKKHVPFLDSSFAHHKKDSAAHDSIVIGKKSHKETTNLFPNPSRGNVTINADSTVTKIEVVNVTTGTIVAQSENVSAFDISELPAGMYMIKIKIGDEIITKTVTKQ